MADDILGKFDPESFSAEPVGFNGYVYPATGYSSPLNGAFASSIPGNLELVRDAKWGTNPASQETEYVSFGFPSSTTYTTLSTYTYGYLVDTQASPSSFNGFSPAQEDAARHALQRYTEVADIKFVDKEEGNAAIRFANTSDLAGTEKETYDSSYGEAYQPGLEADPIKAQNGDVWIYRGYAENLDGTPKPAEFWQPGTKGQYLILHETGHALGLKHPDVDSSIDSVANTVMSIKPFAATNEWGRGNMGYAPQSFEFRYDGGSSRLTFESLDISNYGPVIDDVKITKVSDSTLVPVENGSFEQGTYTPESASFLTLSPFPGAAPLTGWTVQLGTVDWVEKKYWEASDGSKSIDLSGYNAGIIYQNQDLKLDKNQWYRVDFDLSGNFDGPSDAAKYVRVSIDNDQKTFKYQNPDENNLPFYPTTLMPYGIEAVQYTYGVNWDHNDDDTTYKLVPGQQFYETIWDAGGTDTIDFSAATDETYISLLNGNLIKRDAAGNKEYEKDAQGNNVLDGNGEFIPLSKTSEIFDPDGTYKLLIAFEGKDKDGNVAKGADGKPLNLNAIENAIGGSGSDFLEGNSVANYLVGGAPIVNGSFEDGVSVPTLASEGFVTLPDTAKPFGWAVRQETVDWVQSLWNASDGKKSIDLSGDNAGKLYQDVSGLVVGKTYRIEFDLSGNFLPDPNNDRDTAKDVQVSIDQVAKTFTFTRPAGWSLTNMGYAPQSLEFTYTGASPRLTFKSLDESFFGPVIDNVKIRDQNTLVPIASGSFEDGLYEPESASFVTLPGAATLTGWKVQPTVDWVQSLWDASKGTKSIDLSGNNAGTIYQDLGGLVEGRTYRIEFDLSGDFLRDPYNDLDTAKVVQVSIDGVQEDFTFTRPVDWSQSNMGYAPQSFEFTYTGSSPRLTFESRDYSAWGPVIDNVNVRHIESAGDRFGLDTLVGGGGNDTLVGSPTLDRLYGSYKNPWPADGDGDVFKIVADDIQPYVTGQNNTILVRFGHRLDKRGDYGNGDKIDLSEFGSGDWKLVDPGDPLTPGTIRVNNHSWTVEGYPTSLLQGKDSDGDYFQMFIDDGSANGDQYTVEDFIGVSDYSALL